MPPTHKHKHPFAYATHTILYINTPSPFSTFKNIELTTSTDSNSNKQKTCVKKMSQILTKNTAF